MLCCFSVCKIYDATAQNMKFLADMVTFTEKILNENLIFCAVCKVLKEHVVLLSLTYQLFH